MGSLCAGERNTKKLTHGTSAAINKPGESFQEEDDDEEDNEKNNKDEQEEKYASTTTSPVSSPKVLDRMENRIAVHVIQGRHLPNSDVLGNSDPYVKVTFVSKSNSQKPLEESRTCIRRKTRNPVWNDAIVCQGPGIINDCKAIVFDVWDYDVATKDDFIGTATITGVEHMRGSALPVWLLLKNKKGKSVGEIQIQVSVTEDCNTLAIRDWTHVLELNIGEGVNLDKMPWFKNKNCKPYVRIEWGTQVLHTSKLQNPEDAHWNEKAYLFVHEKANEKYYLQITVMDDSITTESFAQGSISAQKIFESQEDGILEKDVPLTKLQIESDKALTVQNLSTQENSNDEYGTLKVSARLHPKDHVQARYYDALVDHVDENHNGELDKIEVQKLLLSLDVPKDPDSFFRKYDQDANEIWSKAEIVNMLKDYDFQRSPWMALALENFLKNRLSASYDAHLMTGVTEPSHIGNERNIIKVKDRHTGLVVQENIPGYVWQALQLMYNTSTGRVFTRQMTSVLTKMSHDKGRQYDTPESAKEIPHFIELHNLDMTTMVKKRVEDYASFNDFFARAIDPAARPLHSPENENVVICPADSRLMVFPNFVDSFVWVKGNQWTIANLLKERYEEIGKRVEGGSFVIARLAPQDYHRFHWPVSGKVTKVTPIAGALYTVNPISINQPINVYTENKRCIIEIETGEDNFGLVVLIPVGATLVGSYLLFEKDGVKLEEGAQVQRGEVAGEFRFGGSTVLVLFEKGIVHFDQDLISHTNERLETLVQVRDRIGEKKPKPTQSES